jgi:hypothetical protein
VKGTPLGHCPQSAVGSRTHPAPFPNRFNEKLHRNTDKSNEAAAALVVKRKALDALLRGNENERKALLTRHVSELKGMLSLAAPGCRGDASAARPC